MGLPVNVTLGLDKLVETVASATGLTALGTIMNAKGEAKAESILAKKRAETNAEIEILRMQGEEKIAQYVLARNNQRLSNVESVISKAEQQFTSDEQASEEPVEKDWMTRFLGIVEDVSDEDMQDLWARVLAGEVKRPKSYSLRTLEVLRNLSKDEAEIIVKVSKCILDSNYLCIEKYAINLVDKILLDDIGIVCGEDLIRKYTIKTGRQSFVINQKFQINFYAPANTVIKIKCIKLTKAGYEIMKLIQNINYEDFLSNISLTAKHQGATRVTVNQIVKWDGNQYQYYQQEKDI